MLILTKKGRFFLPDFIAISLLASNIMVSNQGVNTPPPLPIENIRSLKYGVDDGARTHDDRNHNPGLYQLSYAHHNFYMLAYKFGTPGRIRTCYPRLRRPMLYPSELQAQNFKTCFT